MSIYKQAESAYWWIKVYAPDGRCVRVSSRTTDKGQARLAEQALKLAFGKTQQVDHIHRLIDSIYGKERPATPLDCAWQRYEQWLEATNRPVAPITLRKRQAALKRFRSWLAREWPAVVTLGDVTRQTATAFAADLAKENIAPKTRLNIIGDLGAIWAAMKNTEEDLQNPWPHVRPQAERNAVNRSFTPEQEAAIFASAAGTAWHLPCLIARWTGLRYGDIARLEAAQVDIAAGTIALTPGKTARHKVKVLIPIAEPLAKPIAAAMAAAGRYVFPDHAAAYPRPEKAAGPGPFSKILRAADIVGGQYTFHSWRHTFRTRLSDAGVSDDMARRLGGWTNMATADRYDHAERLTELRAAIEKTHPPAAPAASGCAPQEQGANH